MTNTFLTVPTWQVEDLSHALPIFPNFSQDILLRLPAGHQSSLSCRCKGSLPMAICWKPCDIKLSTSSKVSLFAIHPCGMAAKGHLQVCLGYFGPRHIDQQAPSSWSGFALLTWEWCATLSASKIDDCVSALTETMITQSSTRSHLQ